MLVENELLKNEEITRMADFVPTTYKLFVEKLAKLRHGSF